jgi:hypothetical protein
MKHGMEDEPSYLAGLVDADEREAKPDVRALALEMRLLKAQVEDGEEAIKLVKARYDDIRKRLLPDAMAAAGLRSFKMADGCSVHVQTKVNANVKEADRPTFYAWLERTGHHGLVHPYVHPSTLTAWAKEQIDNGIDMPAEVTIFAEPMAILRKS